MCYRRAVDSALSVSCLCQSSPSSHKTMEEMKESEDSVERSFASITGHGSQVQFQSNYPGSKSLRIGVAAALLAVCTYSAFHTIFLHVL